MKSFGDERIAAGESCLVVDLSDCTGMDSTFMGTLAGMAARLSVVDGGTLQIAEPGERNRRSLEDLGLDFLLEIDPPKAAWRGQIEAVRSSLVPPELKKEEKQREVAARHVLEAHKNLSQANEKNAKKFSQVVGLLEAEVDKESKKNG
ncbi:hypothetical protein JIN85_14905 [Luteolibacter pohnpeiensis]|uniref:STAS domain-containing protein n=2 Tax=Luteolibacter pohnpeiensis TaxID=454153 RepID=A0A934S5Z0_9BACT|nr:hypothetical protein [Luteolibacter pohnpeiensis]